MNRTARTLLLSLLVLWVASCSSGKQAAEQGTPPTPAELKELIASGRQDFVLIDVRTPEEYRSGHIRGAVLIPLDQFAQRLDEVPKDKRVILYCRSGRRSGIALKILQENGYTNAVNFGGIIDWPYDVVKGDEPGRP